nr:FT like protein [Tanacetum cinerariifolium]
MQQVKQGSLSVITIRVKGIWQGSALSQRGQGNLYDLGVADGQATQTTIPQNAAFQTDDLDTYDSDCDEISSAKAVLMAILSSYNSDVLSEAPNSDTYQTDDMINQNIFNSSPKFASDVGSNAREMTRRLKSVGRKSEVSFNFSKCSLLQKKIDEDIIRHEAIVDVTRLFKQATAAKEYMRKAYAECKDIPQEKRDVIENFFEAEDWKDYEICSALDPLVVARVIGDVLDSFTKSINLSVSYDDREVSNGCELKPSQIMNQPRVDIGGDDLRALHTLVMVDPDAPSPSNPNLGEYLHWLVTNIPATTGARFGQEIVSYESPRPSMGIHRMVFVLFRQMGRQTVYAPGWRQNFNTKDFAELYNLGSPVAAVYFNCQRENGSGRRRR